MRKKIFLSLLLTAAFCAGMVQLLTAQQDNTAEQLPSVYLHKVLPAPSLKQGIPDEVVYQISKIFQSKLHAALHQRFRIISDQEIGKDVVIKDCITDECLQKIARDIKCDYLVYGEIAKSATGNYLFTATMLKRQPAANIAVIDSSIPVEISKKDPDFKNMSDAIHAQTYELVVKADPKMSPLNTSKTMALPFGKTGVKGFFPSTNKLSLWYKLSKDSAVKKTFVLNHATGRDFDMHIYDGDAKIASAESGSIPESLDVVSMNNPICYIAISNFQGQGDFSLAMKEYVDPITTAKWIENNTVSGNFPSTAREMHWYKMKKSDVLNKSFILSHDSGRDFDIALFDGKSKIVFGESGSIPEIIHTKNALFQNDVVLVGISNFQGSGSYTLKVEKYEFAPGAQWFKGPSMTGDFKSPAREHHWYKLKKQDASEKVLHLSHDTGRDFDLIVYDGETRVISAESGSIPETLQIPYLNSDTCFIDVTNYQGFGSYTLSVKEYVDPITTAKWIENNSVNGNFPSTAKETHWYKMKKSDVLQKNFILSHSPGQDFDVALYEGKTKVIFGETNANPEIVSTKNAFFQKDVILVGISNFQGFGPYTLKVEKYEFAPGAKWFKGPSMTGEFKSTAKESQWYKLKKQDASGKTFQLNHNSGPDFDLIIYDGEMRVAAAESGSIPETLQVPFINGDTCFIEVTNYQGSGTYSLSIMDTPYKQENRP